VIYEDHELLVVNKACGLLTVSYEDEHTDTAYDRLLHYVRKGNIRSKSRIYMVHRIDRDTSGVLLFAKTPQVRKVLIENWKSFSKQYLALVHGHPSPSESVITSYLAEQKGYVMASVPETEGGQFAKTGYKVIQQSKKFSLLEIDLFTGRKNQIRAHLSEKGHPVVGDRKYGIDMPRMGKRLYLHAARLNMVHPYTQEPITFSAPTPPAFEALLTGTTVPKKEKGKVKKKTRR
jgi:tRNA pseudouridine32 synthase/23S rRNA pseudouridine746 synthase/23S rRNA pseudouridine1911/1915/1917 synthase